MNTTLTAGVAALVALLTGLAENYLGGYLSTHLGLPVGTVAGVAGALLPVAYSQLPPNVQKEVDTAGNVLLSLKK